MLSRLNTVDNREVDEVDYNPLYSSIEKIYNLFDQKRLESGNSEDAKLAVYMKYLGATLFENHLVKVFIRNIELREEKIYIILGINAASKVVNFEMSYFDPMEDVLLFEHGEAFLNIVEVQKIIEDRIELIKKAMEFQARKEYEVEKNSEWRISSVIRRLDINNDFVFGNKEKRDYVYSQKLKNMVAYLNRHFGLAWAFVDGWAKIPDLETNSPNAKFVLRLRDEDFLLRNFHKQQWIYVEFKAMELKEADAAYDYIMNVVEDTNNLLDEKKKIAKIIRPARFALVSVLDFETGTIMKSLEDALEKYKELEEKWEFIYAPMAIQLLENLKMDLRHGVKITDNYMGLITALADENPDPIVKYYKQKLAYIKPDQEKYCMTIAGVRTALQKLPYKKWGHIFRIGNGYPSHIYDRQLLDFREIMPKDSPDFNYEGFVPDMYNRLVAYDLKNNSNLDSIFDPDLVREEGRLSHFFSKRYKRIKTFDLPEDVLDLYERVVLKFVVNKLKDDPGKIGIPLDKFLQQEGMEPYLHIDRFVKNQKNNVYRHVYNILMKDFSSWEIKDIDFVL